MGIHLSHREINYQITINGITQTITTIIVTVIAIGIILELLGSIY